MFFNEFELRDLRFVNLSSMVSAAIRVRLGATRPPKSYGFQSKCIDKPACTKTVSIVDE